jgi:hypothetical protein
MFAHVVIDGYLHTGNAGVTVEHKFELRADRQEANVGETVTFEPYLDEKKVAAVLWRWMPQAPEGTDPASVTPVEVEACAGKDTCPWALSGSGTMWAYRSNPPSGKTDEEASRAVTARTAPLLKVVFTPERIGLLDPYQQSYVSPTLVNGRPLCTIGEDPSDRYFDVEVKDVSGQDVPGKTVTLSIQGAAQSGGHEHKSRTDSERGRPLGYFASDKKGTNAVTSVTTGESGKVRFYYIPPEFSGEFTITGKSPGATDGTHTLSVGVKDLLPMIPRAQFTPVLGADWSEVKSPDGTFALYDTRDYEDHGFPHNGKAVLLDGLRQLAKAFHDTYKNVEGVKNVLYYNDLSLALGGRFDAEADWGPEEHCSHRWGDAADMRKKELTQDQLNWIEDWWHSFTKYTPPKNKNVKKRNSVGREGDHWHLRLLP